MMRCDANALLHCLPPASQLTQTQPGPLPSRRHIDAPGLLYGSGGLCERRGGDDGRGGRQVCQTKPKPTGGGRSCPRMEIDGFLQTGVSRFAPLLESMPRRLLSPAHVTYTALKPARVSPDGRGREFARPSHWPRRNLCSLPIRAVPVGYYPPVVGLWPGKHRLRASPHTHTTPYHKAEW